MNWPKIWTGALAATLVLGLGELFQGWLLHLPAVTRDMWIGMILLTNLLIIITSLPAGFILSWLYVLARPRLGPGPKTAILMGTLAFVLSHQRLFGYWHFTARTVGINLLTWLSYVAATYVAGWQYIEKAP